MRAAVALFLFAVPSFAVTVTPGRCPDAAPKFTIGPSLHVVVTLTETLPMAVDYGAPAFTMQGNRITVQRTIAPVSADEVCVADSVDLGALSAGQYELTWTDLGFRAPRVMTYSFVVGTRVTLAEYRKPVVILAPVPPVLPGSPVRLVLDYGPFVSSAAPPVASVRGDTIEVTATDVDSGPMGPTTLYLVDLGPLAEGTYHLALTRNYLMGTRIYQSFYSTTFLVQSPPPSAPCGSVPSAKIPLIAVTRTAAGTAQLHFEERRQGYAPAWGPPSVVAIMPNYIATQNIGIYIEQPLTDTFDYTKLGAPPTHDTCHGEDIDLGVLAAGTYAFSWRAIATLGGVGPYALVGGGAFDWNGSEMTCSTTPVFSTSPGLTLSLQRMIITRTFAPTKVEIKGNVITVTDYQAGSPVPDTQFFPLCVTSRVTVGPLAPGEYVVNWQAVPGRGPLPGEFLPPEAIGTYRFTVPAGRARPARH